MYMYIYTCIFEERKMDQEQEIEEESVDDYLEPLEIDWDYEFDAARFFDFSCPESHEDDQEAEHWFAIAGNYPASPLAVKLKSGGSIQGEVTVVTSSLDDGKSNSTDVVIGSEISRSKGIEGAMKSETTSVPRSSKPRSSTLMKPTASHLAKVNKATDSHSSHLHGRFQKSPVHEDERSLQKYPGLYNLATKRQKLEIGYLQKVSHLKHQALLLHKKSQKDGTVFAKTAHSRMNVTIPKEPELETLQRALSRRSKTNSESNGCSELEIQNLRTRSLNRKIFKSPMIVPPKKSKPREPVFQVFNLKTTERALQRSINNDMNLQSYPADLKRSCVLVRPTEVKENCKTSNSNDAVKQEKHETPLKIKGRSISNKIFPTNEETGGFESVGEEAIIAMESKLPKDQRHSQNPPTELFDKLSLRSELGSDTVSRPNTYVSNKGLKENAPDCFQPEFWRCVGKLKQCGSGREIPGTAYKSNMNRTLIR